MPNILCIESSASLCSLALLVKGQVYNREQDGQRSHTQFMLSFVQDLLKEAQINAADLDAIAFSAGPGSFTGIRLAASTAKSLAYALDKPVISISSLAIIAQGFYRLNPGEDAVTVISDARMDELYIGQYDCVNGLAKPRCADALRKFKEVGDLTKAAIVLGDCEKILAPLASFSSVAFKLSHAHAIDMLSLAEDLFAHSDFSSALEAEAVYLRGKNGWKTTAQQQAEKRAKE